MSILVIGLVILALFVVFGAIFFIAAWTERLETPKRPEKPVSPNPAA
jgi:hypothetical protein